MKLAIMQPYFFPYIGYFSLIKHTDQFILLDTVQFIRHGWIERNRILKQDEGWLYVSVPIIRNSRDTLIKDVLIDNNQNWKQKIIAQLQPYKKKAPYYRNVLKMMHELFEKEYTDIVSLNKASLEVVCKYLEIEKNINVFSNMDFVIDKPTAPDEWALNICKANGHVDEYWNPPGGQNLFDISKYKIAGIKLQFQNVSIEPYNQTRQKFEPALSIIDIMMFNTVAKINKMLDNFELI